MSELRAMIVDAAIELTAIESLIDELESALGWGPDTDTGLFRALDLARGEAVDAQGRLTGLARILMNQEGHNV